jgi:ABC-type branched-subunit amino acid transport system substrate-binding protein
LPAPARRPVRGPYAVSRRATTRAVALVGCALLALATVACTHVPPPTPYFPPQGVTDTEITLGSHQPLTGPAAAGYSRVSAATKAYFDYVNANGGVYGRKIVYDVGDDGYNPANTQTVVRKLVEQDKVFAIVGGFGTATHLSVMDYLKDKQIPDLFVTSGATDWNQPSRYPGTFGFQTDYTTEGKIIGHYIQETPTLAEKKACTFVQNDDFGRELVAGLTQTLDSKLASQQTYITSNPNVAIQTQALRQAGCEVVVLATIPGFTAQVLTTASKLHYQPQFISSTVGSDYNTVAGYLGVSSGLLEGLISTGYLPIASNTDDPWVKLFQQINDDYGDKGEVDNNVLVGMSIAYLTVQALQRAGHDITVDNLIDAIQQGGFPGPGLVPFGFSKTSHAGYTGGRMSKVTNGVQNYFGPAYVTDAGAAEVTEYTEPAATPPQNGVPTD